MVQGGFKSSVMDAISRIAHLAGPASAVMLGTSAPYDLEGVSKNPMTKAKRKLSKVSNQSPMPVSIAVRPLTKDARCTLYTQVTLAILAQADVMKLSLGPIFAASFPHLVRQS